MSHLTKIIGALCICALAACSGGTQSENSQTAVLKELQRTLKSNRAARKSPPAEFKISRAILDKQTIGSLEVTVENTDTTAFLIPGAYRNDALLGQVAVWRTVTEQNVILRGGVLIATRGLGRDLISNDPAPSLRAIRARGAGGGERRMKVRNDMHGADDFLLQCKTRSVGDTTIDIVELRFNVRHLQEICQTDLGRVTNEFWVNRSGKVLQSRQWAGPHLGYLRIRLLK